MINFHFIYNLLFLKTKGPKNQSHHLNYIKVAHQITQNRRAVSKMKKGGNAYHVKTTSFYFREVDFVETLTICDSISNAPRVEFNGLEVETHSTRIFKPN